MDATVTSEIPVAPARQRLNDERRSFTHRFEILEPAGGRVFYITCGMYSNGRLGELFIRVGKEGSLIDGALDALAVSISIGLQHGIPLQSYTTKLRFMKFEPAGPVLGAPDDLTVGQSMGHMVAQSPCDYIGAYLDWKFPDGGLRDEDRQGWVELEDVRAH